MIKAKCAPYLAHGQPERRTELMNLTDLLIISTYGAEYRGIVQYYLLAGDVLRLNRLEWVASTSMLKTLAAKHGSTVTKMARKHKAKTGTPRGPRTCFEATVERAGRKPLVARFGGIPLTRQKKAGPHRPRARPGHRPQGADNPAPQRPVRVVRASRPGGNPPGPQARRPRRQAGTAAARVGAPHGHHAQEDPRGLHLLPHGHPRRAANRRIHAIVTGEPRAGKLARVVRTGGRWKRTCHNGRHLASGLPVCKLRGKQLVTKPARTRRYYLPGPAARTISALLTLRDHVIAPILAGVQIRRHDHVPARLTPIDQDYEHLRTDMATLFSHLGIQPGPAAA